MGTNTSKDTDYNTLSAAMHLVGTVSLPAYV